jgi:hypothetical protein
MELVERIQKAKKEVGPALWPVVLSCLLRGVGLRVHIFIDAIGAETQWKLEADVSKLE